MPYSPNPLGVPRVTGQGPSSGPRPRLGTQSGISSPQGYAWPSRPPRAARSHSASVGSRTAAPGRERQAQYATASCQLTPTTGRSSRRNAGLSHSRGGSRPAASRNAAYSARVTGWTAIRNPSTHTRWTGRSEGWPSSLPIRNQPGGMVTNSDMGAVRRPAGEPGYISGTTTSTRSPSRETVTSTSSPGW